MSSYLVPSGDGYKFTSLERLRRFLNLESPYDACLECELPRSKSASLRNKKLLPEQLDMLVESAVPSPEAADCLHNLSDLVICARTCCRKQPPLLYETWCDKLWRHYLRVHKLSLNDYGSRPIGFTQEEWESALEEDDSASDSVSDSAYWSNQYSDPDHDPDHDPDTDWDEDSSTNGDEDTDTEGLGIESLSITSEARPKTKLSFSKFRQLSPNDHRQKLFNLIMTTISSDKNCCPGYIYGFRRPDLPGYIKIGYVKGSANDAVKNRLAEWRRKCKHEIEEVFSKKIECDAIQRIESLIHTTLHEYRRKQNPPCESCRKQGRGGKHDEWFRVDENMASKVVNFWARFAKSQPYKLGRLSKFWHDDIYYQRFSAKFPEDYPVMSWMEAMTPLIELLAERESPDRWKV